MKNIFIILFLFCGLSSVKKLNAQLLEQHRWEHRVLLIFTPDTQSDFYKKQISYLTGELEGLKERKLFIYHLTPGKVKSESEWKSNPDLSNSFYKYYKVKEGTFAVILVGLDGGEKIRKYESLNTEELFEKIDQMPMRMNEIYRKKKND